MSIITTLTINPKEARDKVTQVLKYQQEILINHAVANMDTWELLDILNKDVTYIEYLIDDDSPSL